MTVDLQNSLGHGKIGFDSGLDLNDEFFHLEEDGLISTKKSKFSDTKQLQISSKGTLDKTEKMASKYSDEYDSYDEDFDTPTPPGNGSRTRTRGESISNNDSRPRVQYTPSPPQNKKKNNTSRRRESLASYRSAYGASRVPTKASHKGKKSFSANSRLADTSTMVQRVLSANRRKVTKLYNTVDELQQEVDSLKQENRTLKRIHTKQEKELKRVDGDEGNLPQLLQRHSAELRTVRERLKRNKQDLVMKEKESSNHDAEIVTLRDKLKHYKELASNKKLEEREALAKRLEKVEESMGAKDKKISELQRTITMAEKARQRELKEHRDRYKKAREELTRVQEDFRELRNRLQEKEKQLELTNIYHQQIQRGKKKSELLALPGGTALIAEQHKTTASHGDKKRTNIFLTNAPSDASSVTTEIAVGSNLRGSDKVSIKFTERAIGEVKTEFEDSRRLELESQRKEAERLEEFEREREAARRREEEDRRERSRREEEVRRREEEERRKREEEEKKRREEDERKRKEEERLGKIKLEEERLKREKEEELDRQKFEEDEAIRKKRELLLARMRAIDNQENPKLNGIIDTGLDFSSKENKPKKIPIFLQSSADKPKPSLEEPNKRPENELVFEDGRRKSSSSSSRSKQSVSYDFKETIVNLHNGLPAHPSDQHIRLSSSKTGSSNQADGDLSFGGYKPSVHVGRREEPTYNPSFAGEQNKPARKNSGLDFGKTNPKSNTATSIPPPKEQKDDVVFGSYQPTFAGRSSKDAAKTKREDVDDLFGVGRRQPRRARGDANKSGTTAFGEDILFSDPKPKKEEPLFGPAITTSGSKGQYPWENKVNVSKKLIEKEDESLLPRRKKIQQGFGQGTETRAVGNALNDTIDDDIEEVIL